jgi:hypothetical protein
MNLRAVVRASFGTSRPRRLTPSLLAGVIVFVALVAAFASLASAASSFPDVPASHQYYVAITDLASRNIIGGYVNGDFGPSATVTRQQFAKMIVLTYGYPVSENDVCSFTDVVKGGATTFYPDNYVAVCAAKGITTGKTATTFDPLGSITRYQVLTMVVRAADDLDPSVLTAPPPGWTGNAIWAGNATHGANAARAEYNGLLAGLNVSALDPSGNMTRGEAAQVLYNLLGKLGKLPGSTTTTTIASTTTSSTTPVTASAFENLGGVVTSAPAVCSQRSGLLDVFARGANGALMHKSWNGTVWSDWEDLGGMMKPGSDPAAASWGSGRLDVFIRGTDDAVWHRSWGGSTWSDWESLGGALTGSPAAACRDTGGGHKWLDVYTLGSDNYLWHRTFDGAVWAPWTSSDAGGLSFQSGLSPAAVSWGGTRIDLFICGTDGALWHRYLPPGGDWSPWESLGGQVTSSPSASSWGSWAENRLDVFVRAGDNGLWHRSLTSGIWSAWENMKVGVIASAPAAVSWGHDRIDVFVRGTDDALWHRWWDGSAWRP